jgi:MOSC domain-containing protein YiiM
VGDVRVASVNVGRPVPLRVAGEPVPSAIGKHAIAGPVAVGRTNLAGDEQGDKVNHGGPEQAVYAYAAEDAEASGSSKPIWQPGSVITARPCRTSKPREKMAEAGSCCGGRPTTRG